MYSPVYVQIFITEGKTLKIIFLLQKKIFFFFGNKFKNIT